MKRLALLAVIVAAMLLALLLAARPTSPASGLVAPTARTGQATRVVETTESQAQVLEAPRIATREGPTVVELESAAWIEGRVEFPEGASKEDVYVVAVGKPFNDRVLNPESTAAVEADGTFSLTVREPDWPLSLRIDAEYLLLHPEVQVRSDDRMDHVVLRPVLGARILGRVENADKMTRAHTIPGETILLTELRSLGLLSFSRSRSRPANTRWLSRKTKIGDDFTYDFGVVPADREYQIKYRPSYFLGAESAAFRSKAQTTHLVETRLCPGVNISGRLVDPDCNPITDAAMFIDHEGLGDFSSKVHTHEDGWFEIACDPGDVTIGVGSNWRTDHFPLGPVHQDIDQLVLVFSP